MKVKTSTKGQYDSIKGALLLVIALFIGPATYTAMMNAMNDGDPMKYMMALGLVLVGVVLILIYRIIVVEDDDEVKVEEEEPEEEEEDEEEDKPEPPKESDPVASPSS